MNGFNLYRYKRLSPEARKVVVDSLGMQVDILHATARNVKAGGLSDEYEREAADWLSEVRRRLQR